MGDSQGHGSLAATTTTPQPPTATATATASEEGETASSSIMENIAEEEGSDSEDIASTYYFNDFQDMKEHMSSPQTRSREDKKQRSTLFNGPSKPQDKYTRLENEIERSNQNFIDDTQAQQQCMLESQDDQLELIGSSVGVLKSVSQQVGHELDEQAVMLDDFAHEMDNTETKMDNVMKKMAKVLHMSNDRRQWCAIGILLLIMVIIIILFILL